MTEVHHPPPRGKGGDPSFALLALGRFIDAALALDAAWHEVLDCPAYPRYLPSFDEFVRHLQDWQEEAEDRPYVEESPERKPLDLADPAMVRAWLAALRTQVADALAAGEDATRRPSRRRLGRQTARRTLQEASRAVEQLLEVADRGVAKATPG
jgi:hypothetical protein